MGRVLIGSLVVFAFCGAGVVSADEQGVAFANLKDGDHVTSPVQVKMEVLGMKVAKAGTLDDGTGHHHLIVDGGCVEKGAVIGTGDGIYHFGGAQTEATINLTPGKHTLTMQFADGVHRSYGDTMCKTIALTVSE